MNCSPTKHQRRKCKLAEILKQTRSICATCSEIIPAAYEIREHDHVFFTRICPTHGVADTDLGYHAAYYRKSFDVEKLMLERYGDVGTPIFPKDSLLILYANQQGWLFWKLPSAVTLPAPVSYTHLTLPTILRV